MANPFNRRKTDSRGERRRKSGTRPEPQAPAPSLPARGIYALMGATGGVGTTSAACALATEIAAQLERDAPVRGVVEPRVCLIDLDFECGACAHHLDLLPTLSPDDLRRPPSQFDASVLSAMVDQSVAGVTLISAPNGTGGADPAGVDPRTVLALLDAASQLFDHVVLDVPRTLQPWTAAALAGADVSMILCELTVPSLHMARLRRAQLGPALGQAGGELLPVIAKVERRTGRGALSVGDAQTALGVPAFASLPLDPEPLRVVVNSGEPLRAARPDCRFMRAVAELGAQVARRVAATAEPLALQQPCQLTGTQAAA